MKRRILYAAAAALLMFSAQGCTVFSWGGSAKPLAPEPRAEDVFKEGEDLLAKGKYTEARQKYGKVKESDPEKQYDALVQVRLGDSYYEEAGYAEAEVEYKRFLEMHPHNKAAPYVKYQIGMCSFKQMDRADRDSSFAVNAAKQFEELLKDYPDNPYVEEATEKLKIARGRVAESEFVVGWYYYKRGVYKAAAARFKGMVEGYPGSKDEPEALYYLADSYIETKEYDHAKDALARLYQSYPNNRFAEKAKERLAKRIDKAEKGGAK